MIKLTFLPLLYAVVNYLVLRFNIILMQKLKTDVVKDNCNPEWNEELTLYVRDVNIPIHLVSTQNNPYQRSVMLKGYHYQNGLMLDC